MPKTDERLTAANLVFYYTFSNLSTAGELDSWFIGFLSASEGLIEISRIRLHNLYSRHAEEGGPAELNLPEAHARGRCQSAVRILYLSQCPHGSGRNPGRVGSIHFRSAQ